MTERMDMRDAANATGCTRGAITGGARVPSHGGVGEAIREGFATQRSWHSHPAELDIVLGDTQIGDAQNKQQFPPSQCGGGLGRGRRFAASIVALLVLISLCLLIPVMADAAGDTSAQNLVFIPAGSFESVLPASNKAKRIEVNAFRLDATPVTNAQYSRFVKTHPTWRRDRIARLFADEQYLQHWASATQPYENGAAQPVVHVSWFAASAYCEARGARLPTWHEWEYVAAASESQRDARSNPQWRQEILAWYSQSARKGLPEVGRTPANVYGIRDVHGVVWEWIEDLPSMLVANDSREQGDPNQTRFCGAGAVSMEQKENYAMLMRIAMLSSMKAHYTNATMGFRCAANGDTQP